MIFALANSKACMRLKKIIFLGFLFVTTFNVAQEATLSSASKISLLTVGPGDQVYAKYGHSGFRIQDPALGLDRIYDYGGFDFEAPFFIWKFARGKLDYHMSRYPTDLFIKIYKNENRWVQEQNLNLTQAQKNQLFAFLQNNYREENRNYRYDFLFDNCATKIPEVLKDGLGDQLQFNYSHLENLFTFRQLIHQNLNENDWQTFGIDLALGSIIDNKASPWEHQFLPLYVSQQMSNTKVKGEDFVAKSTLLLSEKPKQNKGLFILKPLLWLVLLLLVVMAFTYFDYKKNKRSKWLDFSLFLLTGLAGVLIFFLWFLTDHSFTKDNFNLLWAFPINLVLAIILAKRKTPAKWVIKYLWVLLSFIFVLIMLWLFKIQIFSPLLIFIILALGIRYLFLIHSLGRSEIAQTLNS